MPNLPDRDEREDELIAALSAVFASFRADVEQGAADKVYSFSADPALQPIGV